RGRACGLRAAPPAPASPTQPRPERRADALELRAAYTTAATRCAPPLNKPTPAEIARCEPYLLTELRLFRRVRVVVGLGRIGWAADLRARRALCEPAPRPPPPVGHRGQAPLDHAPP